MDRRDEGLGFSEIAYHDEALESEDVTRWVRDSQREEKESAGASTYVSIGADMVGGVGLRVHRSKGADSSNGSGSSTKNVREFGDEMGGIGKEAGMCDCGWV
ncbi:hypothetical protein GUJ93_ZPchr0015g6634 [Zizania palustris]|uniref:Uncharacterized protein n=1 Tax=Zizania palustris TaxID=103762 RepID=A0A8J5SYT3_ZIZPA|nr:hypothetical protein GUJ93_ZPchr0015g6634 [Zizania palustris]